MLPFTFLHHKSKSQFIVLFVYTRRERIYPLRKPAKILVLYK